MYDTRCVALAIDIITVIDNHSAGVHHLNRVTNGTYRSALAAAGYSHGGNSGSYKNVFVHAFSPLSFFSKSGTGYLKNTEP
jgi:hypothetical protein